MAKFTLSWALFFLSLIFPHANPMLIKRFMYRSEGRPRLQLKRRAFEGLRALGWARYSCLCWNKTAVVIRHLQIDYKTRTDKSKDYFRDSCFPTTKTSQPVTFYHRAIVYVREIKSQWSSCFGVRSGEITLIFKFQQCTDLPHPPTCIFTHWVKDCMVSWVLSE